MENNSEILFSITDDQIENNPEQVWELLQEFYLQDDLPNLTISHLAELSQSSWYSTRSSDKISDFIEKTWVELTNLPGFGNHKLKRLLSILASGLENAERLKGDEAVKVSKQELNIDPEKVRLSLGNFSARTLAFFQNNGLLTLSDLLEFRSTHSASELLRYRGFGKISAAEVESVFQGYQSSEYDILGEYLPIDDKGNLCPVKAFELHLDGLSEVKQQLLKSRLINGDTLESAAKVANLTRERTRQVEAKFLEFAESVLIEFPDFKLQLKKAWENGHSLSEWFKQSETWVEYCAAGVKTFFDRTEEGRCMLMQKTEKVEELVGEIRNEWSFYAETFVLESFLNQKEAKNLAEEILEKGKKDGIWITCDESESIIPVSVVPKRAVLAYLRTIEPGTILADSLLQDLRACPEFESYSIADLRKLYGNWRADPEFSKWEIHFPSSTGSDATCGPIPERRRRKRGVAATIRIELPNPLLPHAEKTPKFSFQNSETLEEIESILTQAIENSGGETIIGLLDLPDNIPTKCLEATEFAISGQVDRIRFLFQQYPGVACLSLCLKIGQMEDHKFWPEIEDLFGQTLSYQRRIKLSQQFAKAIERLGLRSEYDDDPTGSVLLRPIIFQTGFTPYMVDRFPIIFGGNQILPSPDDYEGIAQFCHQQATRTQITGNFARILKGPGGPFVVSKILTAFQSGDYQRLPNHFRSPVQKVFENSNRESFLRRPYLLYDRNQEVPVIVFPSIPKSIRTNSVAWRLSSDFRFPAVTERRLPISELTGPRLEGTLTGINNQSGKLLFALQIRPDSENPCLFFDLKSGRQVRPVRIEDDSAKHFDISPGSYKTWVQDPLSTNDPEMFETMDHGTVGIVEISPGMDSFVFSHTKIDFVYSPRLRTAILVHGQDLIPVQTREGLDVFSKDLPKMVGYIPNPHNTSYFSTSLKIKVGEETFQKNIPMSAPTSDPYIGIDLNGFLNEELKLIGNSVQKVELSLTSGGNTAKREFLYWKNLLRVTENDGFVCDTIPDNLDVDQSTGIISPEREATSVGFNRISQIIKLSFNGNIYSFSRPGIYASWGSNYEPVPKSLRLPESSTEEIKITSDDSFKWTVYCNDRVLGYTDRDRRTIRTLDFQDLIHEFGGSGRITAKSDFGEKTLFTYSSQKLATKFHYCFDAGYRNHKATFHLRSDYAIAMRVSKESLIDTNGRCSHSDWIPLTISENPSFSKIDFGNWVLSIQLRAADSDITPQDNPGVSGIRAILHSEGTSGVFCDFINIQIKTPSGEVETLLIDDKGKPSHGTLFFSNIAHSYEQERIDLGWSAIVKAAVLDSDLPESRLVYEFRDKLPELSTLLKIKYHRDVWGEVSWLRNLYRDLVKATYTNGTDKDRRRLLRISISGLAWRSQESLASITSTLAMACHAEIAACAAKHFHAEDTGPSNIEIPIDVLGKVGRNGVLPTLTEGKLCPLSQQHFLSYFENFSQVASGIHQKFQKFGFQKWSEDLGDKAELVDLPIQLIPSETSCLSFEHLGICMRNLDRRARQIKLPTTASPDHPLVRVQTAIQAALLGHHSLNSIRNHVKWPNYMDFSFPILPWTQSHFSIKVANLVFGLAAIMRLAAHKKIKDKEFFKTLDLILSTHASQDTLHKNYTILLSFAPELFAFSLLFWEIIIEENERN